MEREINLRGTSGNGHLSVSLESKKTNHGKNHTQMKNEETQGKKTSEIQGQATDDTVQMWKAKYRKVLAVTVSDGDERYATYFRRPTMEILSMIEKIRKTDAVKSASLLFDNCWLGGAEIVKEDAVLKMAAIAGFNSMIDECRVESKNL